MAPRAAHVKRGGGRGRRSPRKSGAGKSKRFPREQAEVTPNFRCGRTFGREQQFMRREDLWFANRWQVKIGWPSSGLLPSPTATCPSTSGPQPAQEKAVICGPPPPQQQQQHSWLQVPANPIRRPQIRLLPSRPPGGGPGSLDWSWAKTRARNGMNWEAVGAACRPSPGHSTL